MNRILIILLALLIWYCKPHNERKRCSPIYIYDSKHLFDVYKNHNDSMNYTIYRTSKTIEKYVDTFLVATNYKIYYLQHYNKYVNYRDTSYKKHITFLDGINMYDNQWLRKEENLDSLWLPIDCWRCGGIYDTAKIYLILPIKDTDSVLFQQVHRRFHQTQ